LPFGNSERFYQLMEKKKMKRIFIAIIFTIATLALSFTATADDDESAFTDAVVLHCVSSLGMTIPDFRVHNLTATDGVPIINFGRLTGDNCADALLVLSIANFTLTKVFAAGANDQGMFFMFTR